MNTEMREEPAKDNQQPIRRKKQWSVGTPYYRLDDCPKCGAKQAEQISEFSPVYLAYAGTGDYGKWIIMCANCGYSIRADTCEQAKKEWNCEFLF